MKVWGGVWGVWVCVGCGVCGWGVWVCVRVGGPMPGLVKFQAKARIAWPPMRDCRAPAAGDSGVGRSGSGWLGYIGGIKT